MKNESEECIQTEAWGGKDRKYRGRGETVKSSNTCIWSSTRNFSKREKENVADARVEEIMAENISELMKNI